MNGKESLKARARAMEGAWRVCSKKKLKGRGNDECLKRSSLDFELLRPTARRTPTRACTTTYDSAVWQQSFAVVSAVGRKLS